MKRGTKDEKTQEAVEEEGCRDRVRKRTTWRRVTARLENRITLNIAHTVLSFYQRTPVELSPVETLVPFINCLLFTQ